MEAPAAQPVYFTQEKLSFLYEHGYVVIEGLVDAEECARSHKEMVEAHALWDARLSMRDDEAWRSANMPLGTIHGINRLFGHFPFQYRLRQQPKYAQAMSEFWTNYFRAFKGQKDRTCTPYDLVTSFDACGLYKAYQPRKNPKTMCWAHTDQGPHKGAEPLDGHCLQGLINLVDSTGPYDGTLVVYDKSHRVHAGLFASIEGTKDYEKADESDWHRYPEAWIRSIAVDGRPYLSEGDPDRHNPAPVPMVRTRVHAPAGAGVFWFSKTLHENQAPYVEYEYCQARDRAVQYVCHIPKEFLTSHDIQERRKAYEEVRQSNHWAAAGRCHLFAKYPRIHGGNVAELKEKVDKIYRYQQENKPLLEGDPQVPGRMVLSDLGRSLVDYHPGYVAPKKRKEKKASKPKEAKEPKKPKVERHRKVLATNEQLREAGYHPEGDDNKKKKKLKQTTLSVIKEVAEKKQDQDQDQSLCCVCWENKRNSVILECGHTQACYDCAKPLLSCPVCRALVTRVVKTFG